MSEKTMPDHHGIYDETKQDKYPNKTIELLIERASCRNFLDKKIEPEVLNYILEAGAKAASGGNLQPFSIIQIESEENKKKIVSLGNQKLIEKAPINLLFCIDFYRNKRWAEVEIAPYSGGKSYDTFWIAFQDTIIAAQNICTAADSFGLGSVYLGTVMNNFRDLKEMLNLPNGVIPVVMLAMGYPKTKKVLRKKFNSEVVVHKEQYQYKSDEEIKAIFQEKYQDVKVEITPERLNIIKEVCRTVHGEEFAQKCLTKIKDQGFISPVQRYFGLHYIANLSLQWNERFISTLQDLGLDFFHNYEPAIPYKKLSEQELKAFTGKFLYEGDPVNDAFELRIKNDQLILAESKDRLIKLFCETENNFYAMEADLKVKFSEDKNSFNIMFYGKQYKANRLKNDIN